MRSMAWKWGKALVLLVCGGMLPVDEARAQSASVAISKEPPLQQVLPGGEASFEITVTNNGDTELVNVEVADPLAPHCERSLGTLAAGESSSYRCRLSAITSNLTNIATVTSETPGGSEVTDSDSASVDVIDPAIEIAPSLSWPARRSSR